MVRSATVRQYRHGYNDRPNEAAFGSDSRIANFARVQNSRLLCVCLIRSLEVAAVDGHGEQHRLLAAWSQLELSFGKRGLPARRLPTFPKERR